MKINAQKTEQQLQGGGGKMGKANQLYDDGQKHNFW